MTHIENHSASNSEVLKSLGRAAIMRHAWFQFKQMGVRPFASALKGAWAAMRAKLALTLRCDAIYAEIKADNVAADNAAKGQLARRKAAYTGDKNSPSPLNPFNPRRNTDWGKGSDRYLNSVMGA